MEEKKEKPVDTKNVKVFLSQRVVLYNPESRKFLIGKEVMYGETFGAWQFPGGRLDKEETVIEGFEREISEEVGDSVQYDTKGFLDIAYNHYYSRSETDGVLTFRLAYYTGGEVEKSDEHDEVKWVSAEEIEEGDEYGDWMNDVVAVSKDRIMQLDAHDNMLRVLAEFDNYKKRSEEQRKEFTAYASEKVIMDMLPVLDNFHAATSHVPEDQADSPWLTGIMYIQKQMEKVFEDAGVSEIAIAEGDAFDAETMTASAKATASEQSSDETDSIEAASIQEEEKVVKIVQKGYKIGGKLMRPARVEVS